MEILLMIFRVLGMYFQIKETNGQEAASQFAMALGNATEKLKSCKTPEEKRDAVNAVIAITSSL